MQSRSSNSKSISKNKYTKGANNNYFLVITILCITIVIILIYYYLSSSKSKSTSLETFFEDPQSGNNDNTPAATTIDYSKVPTAANKDTTCKNTTDVVSVCKSFENCCKSNTSQTNTCFCKHPFITNCYQSYESCVSGSGGDSSKCKEILDSCCDKYSSIDILSTNFQKPISASQTGNQLCSINGLTNPKQRCMELCQTNPDCKAYSIIDGTTMPGNCNLYDKINYTNADPKDNTIYVIKK